MMTRVHWSRPFPCNDTHGRPRHALGLACTEANATLPRPCKATGAPRALCRRHQPASITGSACLRLPSGNMTMTVQRHCSTTSELLASASPLSKQLVLREIGSGLGNPCRLPAEELTSLLQTRSPSGSDASRQIDLLQRLRSFLWIATCVRHQNPRVSDRVVFPFGHLPALDLQMVTASDSNHPEPGLS